MNNALLLTGPGGAGGNPGECGKISLIDLTGKKTFTFPSKHGN